MFIFRSHHGWFEGHAAKCCLLMFIDDATGKLQHLHLCKSESAFDYMISTHLYIKNMGNSPQAKGHVEQANRTYKIV